MLYATIDESSLTVDIKEFSKYLTIGKKYEIIEDELITESELNYPGFWIKTDKGQNIYCLINGCAQLGGGNWIIKDEE